MERPRAEIQSASDEFDHEISQARADAVALADVLLAHKPDGSPLTFVDIVMEGDDEQMLDELAASPFGRLLAAPDEQLAIESDGSYYPVLDIRKESGVFLGMGLRAWGWDEDKWRHTDVGEDYPREFKEYPGEKDKTRELELAMSYRVGRETVTETITLYFGTTPSGTFRASSQLHMMAYAETGYEGHGGKGIGRISDEDAYWFLDFIARHVGDEPKSVREVQDERLNAIRADAERHGVLKGVDKLIKDTWNAQALYMMNLPCRLLDGMSIAEGLKSPDTAAQAGEAARLLAKQYKTKTMNSQAGGEWIVGRKYGGGDTSDEDE